jgi:hypothetical protein
VAPIGERRRLGGILIGIVLTASVLIFAPRPAGREPLGRAVWATDVPTAEYAAPDATSVPFRLAGHLGYVTADGGVSFHEPILYGAAVGGEHFINYSAVSANLAVRDVRGGLIAGVASAGYPILAAGGDWLLSLARTGDHLAAFVASDGTPLWEASVGAPITCLAATREHALVGTAAGALWLFDRVGGRREKLQLDGGEVDVVIGCAARAGLTAAAVAGLRPQRLYTIAISPRLQATAGHLLPTNHRREVPVAISADGRTIATASATGTLLVDAQSGRSSELVGTPPRLIRFGAADAAGLVAVVSAVELVVSGTDGRALLASPGTAIEWLQFSANRLLIGVDEALLRVDIESK